MPTSTIAENKRIKQGTPPCTCGALSFLGLTGLNFAIDGPRMQANYGW